MSNSESFVVDVVGDVTGKTWKGLFKTKLRLSHRDQLKQDEIRRELLGKNAEHASERSKNQAEIFAFVAAHILSAPSWWEANDGGLDLEDDNVVSEVFAGIAKAKTDAVKKLQEEAEGAVEELKKAE